MSCVRLFSKSRRDLQRQEDWIGFDELLIDLQIKFSGPNTVLLGSCIKR